MAWSTAGRLMNLVHKKKKSTDLVQKQAEKWGERL